MVISVGCDDVPLLKKAAASRGNGRIEVFDGLEVLVGERLIDQRPEMLGGLKFRTAGRLIDKSDTVRDGQVLRPVPACIVELEHDDAIAAGAGLAREGVEQLGKERLAEPI